ncbi:pro-thyrotropin-releasing hormone [Callorhinchus milii]|uniref:Uncharacterized protein n=2 Tax=Callorhinchus milii TaxID=7868 RepID=A0A4W3KA22_CALMI|nr:pro-thyrotropin-releasing hormone [Callorhinchus milii]|eukprot:gi/632946596/ref/XP_007888635.1/ PREDICTED: thyrotropin releasing hormone [Callorhinchus milii]
MSSGRLVLMLMLMMLCLTLCNTSVRAGQQLVAEDREGNGKIPLGDILRRAENSIIRSILMKMGEEEEEEEEDSPTALDTDSLQPEWVSKRQHPGKREDGQGEITDYLDAQKRQHPGKREDEGDDDGGDDDDDDYLTPTQKRQHPGKRETQDDLVDLQKRQHPGRRATADQFSETPGQELAFLGELAKRQHPGKRYLTYIKRQHPGRRSWEDERDSSENLPFERRQHPGKRYLDPESSDLPFPCDLNGPPTSCRKAGLLLELLENMNRSQMEEKRQHPGRSVALGDEMEGQE